MLGSIGCTERFEDFNTNPKAPTPEQMEGDFISTATLISTMIPVMVQGQENNYQMIDQMIGCEYGRMTVLVTPGALMLILQPTIPHRLGLALHLILACLRYTLPTSRFVTSLTGRD